MEFKRNFVINALFWGAVALIAYGTYRYILPVLRPFLIGFIIATVIQIPLHRISLKKPKYRPLLSGLLCTLFYAIVIALVMLCGYSLASRVQNLALQLPTFFKDTLYPIFASLATSIEAMLEPIDPNLAEWVIDTGKNIATNLGTVITNLSGSLLKLVASGAVSIPGLIIEIIVTVVSSYYISADYDKVVGFFSQRLPLRIRVFIRDTIQYMKTVVFAYIKSYSIIFVITFVELMLGMLILRVPYAVPIAFGIALFDLMPILGTGGILLPWTVIALLLGKYPMAIGVFLLYLIITVIRQILEPRIVGEQIGLHPLATLVAMIVGLGLLGLVGMILFPVTLVAIVNMRKNRQAPPAADEGESL